MAGYAGTIASSWQAPPDAPAAAGTSAAVLVASSAPWINTSWSIPIISSAAPPEHAYINRRTWKSCWRI